jgi:hypothetical protein
MRWCCAGFHSWQQGVDERGFAIVVDRDEDGKPIFLLQYRAVDRAVSLPDTGGTPVTLIARLAISHCPFCGRNLRKWYRASFTELKSAEPLERLRKELSRIGA